VQLVGGCTLQLEDPAGNQLEKSWFPSSKKMATIFSLELEAGCGHFGGDMGTIMLNVMIATQGLEIGPVLTEIWPKQCYQPK
jgi:hypothetical protein